MWKKNYLPRPFPVSLTGNRRGFKSSNWQLVALPISGQGDRKWAAYYPLPFPVTLTDLEIPLILHFFNNFLN